jgi:glycosyltransferase involved in cell wall biosynthesis
MGWPAVKILVLSFYYPPDLSAGSFRATALVEALAERAGPGAEVDVVTTLPNRYRSFAVTAPERERGDAASVMRIALPAHRSGMTDQSRAFLAYARGVARELRGRRYDVVVATSGRLMTAALGAWVAPRVGARLYLDIRDIFADTIQEVAPGIVGRLAGPVFSQLERWAIRRAAGVNLVSRGFAEYFGRRYPGRRFAFFTNGIDDEFIESSRMARGAGIVSTAPATGEGASRDAITVLYAGNVGEGQGLHAILPELAQRMGPRVRFQVVGDGGRREALARALADRGVSSVTLCDPVSRPELLRLYDAADVLFLHLNDHASFRRVLPSKLFEYAALGKPVWAGVAGYAAEFVRGEIENAAVFPPCDAERAEHAFASLRLERMPRSRFIETYARSRISRALADDVLSVARASGR